MILLMSDQSIMNFFGYGSLIYVLLVPILGIIALSTGNKTASAMVKLPFNLFLIVLIGTPVFWIFHVMFSESSSSYILSFYIHFLGGILIGSLMGLLVLWFISIIVLPIFGVVGLSKSVLNNIKNIFKI